MLTCLRPGQSRGTLACASRNSCSLPGLTLNRTALNAVMTAPPLLDAAARSYALSTVKEMRPPGSKRGLLASHILGGRGIGIGGGPGRIILQPFVALLLLLGGQRAAASEAGRIGGKAIAF